MALRTPTFTIAEGKASGGATLALQTLGLAARTPTYEFQTARTRITCATAPMAFKTSSVGREATSMML